MLVGMDGSSSSLQVLTAQVDLIVGDHGSVSIDSVNFPRDCITKSAS